MSDSTIPVVSLETKARKRLTILRIMAGIAILASLLALARYPFAFGMVAFVGLIALFVGLSVRRRRYDLVAGLMILYPLLPLLILYIHWHLAIRRIVRRSDPLFDGLVGLSDTGCYMCLIAYVGCVSLLVRKAGPEIKRAAWGVVILMPIAWASLLAFTLWDPFGILGYFFR